MNSSASCAVRGREPQETGLLAQLLECLLNLVGLGRAAELAIDRSQAVQHAIPPRRQRACVVQLPEGLFLVVAQNGELGQVHVGSVVGWWPAPPLVENSDRHHRARLAENTSCPRRFNNDGSGASRQGLRQVTAGIVDAAAADQVIGELSPEEIVRQGHFAELRIELQNAFEGGHCLLGFSSL